MVGRQETSGRGALRDSRRARLVPVTVIKSPSSFEVSVEVFSSDMSISNTQTSNSVNFSDPPFTRPHSAHSSSSARHTSESTFTMGKSDANQTKKRSHKAKATDGEIKHKKSQVSMQ
jgi:hypothetical protein